MNIDVLFWIAIAGFLASCLAAIAARSLHLFSRSELEDICQANKAPEPISASRRLGRWRQEVMLTSSETRLT